MSALPRLLDDASVSEKLRADLRRSQMHVVAPFDTAAGLERLRAGMKSGGGPVAPVGGGALPGSSWKLLAALGVAGAIGWLLLSGSSESGTESALSQPLTPALIAPQEEKAASDPSKRSGQLEAPTPVLRKSPNISAEKGGPAAASRPAVLPDAVPHGAVPQGASDPFSDEIAHLGSLRRLHHADPAAAVVSAREGHKQFPQGVLYEEREALLILSLSSLGRSAEAERRVTDFRARFPKSSFLSKMEQIVPVSQEPSPVTR